MQLESRWLGIVNYEEQDMISFPEGIPGFEDEKIFVVVPADQESLFAYLQSINDPDVCLVLTNPFIFFSDYGVELPDEELIRLGNPGAIERIATFTVVNVAEDFKASTTNLMAPIVINTDKKIGLQFIPTSSDYTTKHQLFPAPAAKVGGK